MTDTLSARELVHDLLPKLHATEKVVKNTLGQLIRRHPIFSSTRI